MFVKKHSYLLVVVVALFGLLGLGEYSNAQRSSSVKQTWEYQTVIAQVAQPNLPNDLMPQINKLGADGWELVAVAVTTRDFHVAYLKRLN